MPPVLSKEVYNIHIQNRDGSINAVRAIVKAFSGYSD